MKNMAIQDGSPFAFELARTDMVLSGEGVRVGIVIVAMPVSHHRTGEANDKDRRNDILPSRQDARPFPAFQTLRLTPTHRCQAQGSPETSERSLTMTNTRTAQNQTHSGREVPSLTSLLRSTGLPRATAAADADPAEAREGRQFDRLIGTLTHGLIGSLIPLTRGASNMQIGRPIAEPLASAVPADRRLPNVQAARSRFPGMTSMYLQQAAPGPHVPFRG